MSRAIVAIAFALAAGVVPGAMSATGAAQEPPRPVTDRVGVLSPDTVADLEQRLFQHRDAGHAQIAVLLVPSTGGEPIADYASRTFEALGLGTENVDNGVLLVLAIEDREMRIEVGYGLEERLPDSVALGILETITPALQRGDYDGAVRTAVASLIERTASFAGPPVTDSAAPEPLSNKPGPSFWPSLDLGLCFFAFAFAAILLGAFLWFLRSSAIQPSGYGGYGGYVGANNWTYGPVTGPVHRPQRAWSPPPGPRPSSSSAKKKSSWGSSGGSSWKPSKPSSSSKPSWSSSSSSSSKRSYSGGGGKSGGGGASKRW